VHKTNSRVATARACLVVIVDANHGTKSSESVRNQRIGDGGVVGQIHRGSLTSRNNLQAPGRRNGSLCKFSVLYPNYASLLILIAGQNLPVKSMSLTYFSLGLFCRENLSIHISTNAAGTSACLRVAFAHRLCQIACSLKTKPSLCASIVLLYSLFFENEPISTLQGTTFCVQ